MIFTKEMLTVEYKQSYYENQVIRVRKVNVIVRNKSLKLPRATSLFPLSVGSFSDSSGNVVLFTRAILRRIVSHLDISPFSNKNRADSGINLEKPRNRFYFYVVKKP